MSMALVPLALLMWGMTYPSRALPMLAPGIERLPAWAVTYLRKTGLLANPKRGMALMFGEGIYPVQYCTVSTAGALGMNGLSQLSP